MSKVDVPLGKIFFVFLVLGDILGKYECTNGLKSKTIFDKICWNNIICIFISYDRAIILFHSLEIQHSALCQESLILWNNMIT